MEVTMTMDQVSASELRNSGTSKTNSESFDRNGFLLLKNLVEPQSLICEVPELRGCLKYNTLTNVVQHEEVEPQVNGSLSRYDYTPYIRIHHLIKRKIESVIGSDLYPTYFYDRFYFPGQELTIHTDRPACEISVSIHIRSNLKNPWPFFIKGCDLYNEDKTEIIKKGEVYSAILEAGDGLLYKGCERPHWREPMPGVKRNKIRKLFNKEELFYHQVFFHYVLSNGTRAHHAWDMVNKSKR